VAVFTLHSGATYGLSSSGDNGAFTLGVQFSVSQSVELTGIWFYSGTGTTVLPSACALYNANTGAQIAGTLNSSPSWSGAAGSGWVKCTYTGPTLSSGINYISAAYGSATPTFFFDATGYWTAGGGSGGITSGPLSAPNSAGAVNGQAVFNSGTGITFPATAVSGFDFGMDVEVTTSSNITGTLSLALAPMALALTSTETFSGAMSLAMAPMKLALTGSEVGANITGTLSLALAPMAFAFFSGGITFALGARHVISAAGNTLDQGAPHGGAEPWAT
jgi:hypothetical protein